MNEDKKLQQVDSGGLKLHCMVLFGRHLPVPISVVPLVDV